MEIVYSTNSIEAFKDKKLIGIYGDVLDLDIYDVDVAGIVFDDNWKVKKFLNGGHIFFNKRIYDIFDYLDIDKSFLNYKIKDLSKVIYKYVLLAYILLNNINVIIFDHIEVGMSYKEMRKFKRLVKDLTKNDKQVLIISKNLAFLDTVVEELRVIENKKEVYSGDVMGVFESDVKVIEPEIIKFINMANRKDAKLSMTLDNKELLKDIYRSVA